MTTSLIDTVNAYFEAFAARDLDRAVSCFAPDADWMIPGDATLTPWVGHRTGPQQIRQSLNAFFADVEPVEFVPLPLIEAGDLVLAQAAYTSRFQPSGQLFTSEVVMRFTVADGLITAYRVFEDSTGLGARRGGGAHRRHRGRRSGPGPATPASHGAASRESGQRR